VAEIEAKASGGIGFLGLLTVLFVGLKLTHNIDWSWFWVLAPLVVPLAIWLAIIAVLAVVIAVLD
jgi:hypothetical protein